jgi:branched-chain amino acid transport system ATP-binding protein
MSGADATSAALRLRGLTAGYGHSDALRSLTLDVPTHRVTAVVGPNGAGKSTLMKCLAGIHRPSAGSIELFGEDVTTADARALLARGLSLCPERRRIFPGMTVEENLLLGAVTLRPALARARVRQAYERFPWLEERRTSMGGNLSGGQQQMLAICRAIMTQPALLLLDEPSLGLSPRVVTEVADLIRSLAREEMTVVIVEQNVSLGLKLADHVHVLSRGEIVRSGTSEELQQDTDLVAAYLG